MASETRIRLLQVGDGPTVDREFWALLDPGATIGMIVDFQRDGRVSQKWLDAFSRAPIRMWRNDDTLCYEVTQLAFDGAFELERFDPSRHGRRLLGSRRN